MYGIDTSTSTNAMPTPQAANASGWFQQGNPVTGTPSTVTSADWANGIQAELLNILSYAGVTPDKADTNQVITSIISLFRQKLTGNLTLYVNGTTGNDSNNGSSGAPFATLQAAATYITQKLDLQSYAVTVNVAAGTYAGVTLAGNTVGATGAAAVVFNGNTVSPDTVVISMTGNGQACFSAEGGAQFSVQGFKMTSTGASGWGLNATGAGSQITLSGNCDISSCTGADLVASNGALVNIASAYTVSGTSGSAWRAFQSGSITMSSGSVTLSSAAFTTAFALIDGPSTISLPSPTPTFNGTTSGQCFVVTHGGYFATGTGNTSFVPGTSAGTSTTGYFT